MASTERTNSRTVSKRIRCDVWPVLRDAGFTAFSSRTAWRHTCEAIDVVNFQSFNSYLAGSLGCTTFSFCLNLGKYLTYVPHPYGPDRLQSVAGALRPAEYQCPLRRTLDKKLAQAEFPRADVWSVDPCGSNLDGVFAHVVSVLPTALLWFDAYESPHAVYRLLRDEDEGSHGSWGFGANPSPMRHYLAGYAALRIGALCEARRHFATAIESSCFADAEPAMRAALGQTTRP